MAAASKNKRGRPSVFARPGGREEEAAYKGIFVPLHTGSARKLANSLYVTEGINAAAECVNVRETFYTKDGTAKGKAILEQIGRMRLQEGYSADTCKTILEVSVTLWKAGIPVKTIESKIRKSRISGSWEWLSQLFESEQVNPGGE